MKSYTLFGSTTSPYVRRLRIIMRDLPCELSKLSIFDQADRVKLKSMSPILRIPFIQIHDGANASTLYDSRVIFNYLNRTYWQQEISLEDENTLSVIDSINDAFVTLYTMQVGGVHVDEAASFVKVQRERVIEGFDYLSSLWTDDRAWDYPAISLYCLIDWMDFRGLENIQKWPRLQAFWHKNQTRPEVMATDPRS